MKPLYRDPSRTPEERAKDLLSRMTLPEKLGQMRLMQITGAEMRSGLPDLAALEKLPGCRRVEIEQAYLKTAADEKLRVRKWVEDGRAIYYKTRRRRLNGRKLEVEERLTQRAYKEMLEEAGETVQLLHKTRYSLAYEGQLFQLNVYPFWQDQAVVKIELNEEHGQVRLPPELTLIREVTGEREFKDYSLAALMPD